MNQIVEDFLRSYCSKEPKKWIEYLPMVEFAYNNNHHSTIQMSPFQALYGQECRTPINWHDPLIKVKATREMLDEMQRQKTLIQESIRSAQQKYQSLS